MTTAKPPAQACPKCGTKEWNGPTYRPAGFCPPATSEVLVWECNTCRFKMTTPCLDAEPYKNPNCTINHPGSPCNVACGEY